MSAIGCVSPASTFCVFASIIIALYLYINIYVSTYLCYLINDHLPRILPINALHSGNKIIKYSCS